jgi:hypothetical protein
MRNARHFGTEASSTRARALSRTGRTLRTVSLPVVLIPGAGGQAWVWHLVEADLRRRGYDAFAVDLPAADESKGLPAYADAVVSAIGDHTDSAQAPVTIAAYSLGAFTAPLVWQRVPARQVIFVNAMIPRPGETPGAWWDNVGWEQARTTAARRKATPPTSTGHLFPARHPGGPSPADARSRCGAVTRPVRG